MDRAWERSIASRPAATEPIERAAVAGALVAPIASAPAGLLYLHRFWATEDLPWLALVPQLASFVALTGALYAGASAAGVVVGARVHRAAMLPLAALAGAIGGLAPGAFAAWHFGSMDAPWFGGHGIAIAAGLGAIAMAAAVVRAMRPGLGIVRALLHALAPLPIAGPLVLAAILLGAQGIDWRAIDPLAQRIGAIPVGTMVGAIVGIGLGSWIGASATIAARSPSRSSSRPPQGAGSGAQPKRR